MRKKLANILLILTVVTIFALTGFAQSNNKLIQLKENKPVTEKFTIPANDGITYVFNAKDGNLIKFSVGALYADGTEGQGLSIELANLSDPDKVLTSAAPGEEVEFQIMKSDDYVVTVMNPGRKKANITFSMTLNPETSVDSDVCEGCDYPGSAEIERIKLGKGQTDVDLDIQLEGRATKSFVANVLKGYMTCIMPDVNLGSGVTIRIDGKVHNPANGPCTAHAKTSGDQVIEFINNGNKEKNFSVSVGFHQKM